MVCVCVLISTPPCIYRRDPWGEPCRTALGIQRGGDTWLVEAVGPTGLFGRPGWSADGPVGPHRINSSTWQSPIGSLWRFHEVEAMAPSYKYNGGRE